MVADGVNEGSKALRLSYPAILAHIGNHSTEGFLLQVLHLVGTQSPRPQLDPQKLFKIGDKVLLGRGVPRPQPFHICSVKSVELHASLCFLGQEYSLARPPGAMELPFHSIVLKRNAPLPHYSFVETPSILRESLSVGNLPRPPCAPVGASWPALNGPGCASLLPRVGQF